MTFQAGKSGNPGGRPKVTMADGRSLRDLAREHTEEALTALVKVIRDTESDAARVTAINTLFDRGWGKATQPISGDDEGDPIRAAIEVLFRGKVSDAG